MAACSQSSIHFCRFSRIWAPPLVGKALISRQELLKCPMPDITREIAKQVGRAVSNWRDEAARHGLAKNGIDRMASAFGHEDLRLASGR